MATLVSALAMAAACGEPASEPRLSMPAPAMRSLAPHVADGRPTLRAPNTRAGTDASFSQAGAHARVGAHELTLVASAIERGGARSALASSAPPEIVGADVRFARGAGVVEWWRALPNAIEHGVTLAERPAGDGPVRIELEVTGDLSPRGGSADAVDLLDRGGRPVGRYEHVTAIDSAGSILPARLEARDGRIALVIDDDEARYPVLVDPLLVALEEARIVPAGAATDDEAGWSVALTADGSRALVGVHRANVTAGSARVLVRTGTSWAEEATLDVSDGEPGDFFGESVALSADGTRALVVASGDDTARIFTRTGAVWSEEALLAVPWIRDRCDRSAALSADGSRALVGAQDAGRAHVFVRSGTSWVQEAVLSPSSAGEGFGAAVDLAAGGDRALVGAPFDSGVGFDLGSARVFVRTGTVWAEEATLMASSARQYDLFGVSVALSSDAGWAIVGASGDDTSRGLNAGSARVFRRSGSAWTEEAVLLSSDGATDDELGNAVALSADATRALVGAHYGDTHGRDVGSARVYLRTGTSWVEDALLVPASTAGLFRMARSVALAADGARAIVGAPEDGISGLRTGSVRVFTLEPARADGVGCTTDRQCASGFCTDAVCCAVRCGASAPDCEACSAALTGTTDGSCAALAPAVAPTIECRAAAAVCDVPESCETGSTACPPDALRPAGTTCRATIGSCDFAESCTGTSVDCPPDVAAPAAAGTVCRAASGPCDGAERCDGSNVACPADGLVAVGTTCRPVAGSCDVEETCDGSSAQCPPDVVRAGTVTCRATAGDCDVPELCDGGSAACPSDAHRALGVPCRAATGVCDAADVCTGTDPECIDGVLPAGTTCRPAAAGCDEPETCDGASATCPVDGVRPAGSECAPSGPEICDAPDVCNGSTPNCPPAFLSGVECRPAGGVCDIAEVCSGTSSSCPPDGLLAAGVSCRPSSDTGCDPEEVCDGTAAACPTDTTRCGDARTGEDGGPPADAGGALDGGAPPPEAATGCGCTVRSASTGASVALVLALVLAAARPRAARRRRSIRG